MSGSLSDVKWAWTLTPFKHLVLHSTETVQDDIAIMPAPVWAQYSGTGEPEGNVSIYQPGAISLAFSDRRDPNADAAAHLRIWGMEVAQRLRAASVPGPWYITAGYRQNPTGPFGPYRDHYVFVEAPFDTRRPDCINAVLSATVEEFPVAQGYVPEFSGDPVEPTLAAIRDAWDFLFNYYAGWAGHPMVKPNLSGAHRPFIGPDTLIASEE